VSLFGIHMVFLPSLAASEIIRAEDISDKKTLDLMIASMQNETRSFGLLPLAKTKEAKRSVEVIITAYSSTVDQTDDTPFITASNTTVRHGIIATNFLPFGTKVKFPELYGDELFIVEDRMNKRYTHRVDIWMQERSDAINFGIRKTKMEIFR